MSASVFVFLYFYTDPLLNAVLKGRIKETFQEAYPAYSISIDSMHYDIAKNRLGFAGVALTAIDSTISCTIAAYSVSGIGWFQLLWARGIVPNGFTGTVLDAHGIVVNVLQEQYEARCESLRVSVPDSEIVVEGLTFHPVGNDERFFAGSKFRRTRFRLFIPEARVMGLACLELLQGKMYRARSAHIRDLFIDVLVNKDKSPARDTASPPMPNEILASVEEIIRVDSVNLWNAALRYGERFAIGSKAAVIALDSMRVSILGINNRGDGADTVMIRAKGKFMKSATIAIQMSIPRSSVFSLQYSGSLSSMKLNVLNPFTDPAEQIRIKSGDLQRGSFDISVTNGRATGSVRAVYTDLTLATVNKRTGSEKGILDVLGSFVANNIRIRRTNLPGPSMKIGEVRYTRRRDDPFFQFVWFALRSGMGDIVGF